MKKIIIFLAVVCMILSCFTISTLAAETYTVKAGTYKAYGSPANIVSLYLSFVCPATNSNHTEIVVRNGSVQFGMGNVAYSNGQWYYDSIVVEEDQELPETHYEIFMGLFKLEEVETEPPITECDGTACPVGDANHDNYCDDCGLPMVYNLRSTLLDYAHSEIDRALSGSIPSGQYWLVVKAAPSYPGGPDSYYLYISAEKFYLNGNTLLAGTGNALVHRALVSQDSDGDFNASGWSSAQTGSHILVVSDVVDSSHGTSFFFPIPLWWEMEAVGEQALTEQAVPKVVSAMKIVTVCSVGLLALVIALVLCSTKLKRFLP